MPLPSSTAEKKLDLIFHALSDSTRRNLLGRLATKGPALITELAAPFSMSLPGLSKHIRVLERAKLVKRDVDGRAHYCSLGIEPFREIERWMEYYRKFWDETLDSLADFVEAEQKKK